MSEPAPYFEVHGRDDPSLPFVLLSSGLGGSARYWAPQMEALKARYRVVVYDQRGTGRTPGPLPTPYSMADMATDALQVLDAVGAARADFVGHALGGLIGLALAAAQPDRVGRLVVINGWVTLSPHTSTCFDIRLDVLERSGWAAYVRAQPLFLYPAWWMARHPEQMRAEAQHALSHPPAKADLILRISALRGFDACQVLADLKTPTLVIAAEDDLLVPYDAAIALAEALPNARLSLLPKGGHAVNVTMAEDFNDHLLRFLSR